MRNLKKRVVTIGGGTGSYGVLRRLWRAPFSDITAIVSTGDDGGNSGTCRDELGVLPPGDVLQALLALSDEADGDEESILRRLLNYRFDRGETLSGHKIGNLLLSALCELTGSFDTAAINLGKLLNIHGTVLPVTTQPITLFAQFSSEVIQGEHAIEEYMRETDEDVVRLWCEPECAVNPLAAEAILAADMIVFCPGSMYTSLLPNFLARGMTEVIHASKAIVVHITNLMTEKGHASAYTVQDYANLVESYLDSPRLDYVIYNTAVPDAALLERYRQEMERQPVILDQSTSQRHRYRLIGHDLLSHDFTPRTSGADALASTRALIRHDSDQLAELLYDLTSIDRVLPILTQAIVRR